MKINSPESSVTIVLREISLTNNSTSLADSEKPLTEMVFWLTKSGKGDSRGGDGGVLSSVVFTDGLKLPKKMANLASTGTPRKMNRPTTTEAPIRLNTTFLRFCLSWRLWRGL